MAHLKIRTVFKGFETVDLYYIERNYNDGQEAIWKKIIEVRDGKEKVLAHRRHIGTEFHPELNTDDEKHQWLVGLHHDRISNIQHKLKLFLRYLMKYSTLHSYQYLTINLLYLID